MGGVRRVDDEIAIGEGGDEEVVVEEESLVTQVMGVGIITSK